jgi:hypothetical protein
MNMKTTQLVILMFLPSRDPQATQDLLNGI